MRNAAGWMPREGLHAAACPGDSPGGCRCISGGASSQGLQQAAASRRFLAARLQCGPLHGLKASAGVLSSVYMWC
jgi:hypothetical protein